MAFLPPHALTLTGGCFCRANRYVITVPSLEERPLHPTALPTPISANETIPTRIPVIDIDHCKNCRQMSGALFQCWFICPAAWVRWTLQTPDVEKQVSCEEAVGPVEQPMKASITRFNATDRATRAFCSKCGTNLSYFSHKRAGESAIVDIAVGSLDQDCLEMVRPDRHGWWDFGIGWIRDLVTRGDGGLIRHQTGDMSKAVEN
jgi:hypothetical protein